MKKIPSNVNTILDEFVNGVNEILGNRMKKIILYGSYARGDFQKNSDIDIMILTDLKEIWDFAYDLEYKYAFDITLSPLVKNIDKFNYWLEAMPFYINVQKEGVVLSES